MPHLVVGGHIWLFMRFIIIKVHNKVYNKVHNKVHSKGYKEVHNKVHSIHEHSTWGRRGGG